MGRCKVFTNSVSDISPELAREYNITIVPDVVLFRDREYFCGVDMDHPKLYKMMRESPKLPTARRHKQRSPRRRMASSP